jgi:hypothetical protein
MLSMCCRKTSGVTAKGRAHSDASDETEWYSSTGTVVTATVVAQRRKLLDFAYAPCKENGHAIDIALVGPHEPRRGPLEPSCLPARA